jgi:hypothetical protein
MIGSRVRAVERRPPSSWVETFVSLLAVTAPEWGLFVSALVSANGLCLAEGALCGFVSVSKISIPRFGGDRFDDWLVPLSEIAQPTFDASTTTLVWAVGDGAACRDNVSRRGTEAAVPKPILNFCQYSVHAAPSVQRRMTTTKVVAEANGFEDRTFGCIKCGHLERRMAVDSLASLPVVAWTTGELKPPE